MLKCDWNAMLQQLNLYKTVANELAMNMHLKNLQILI